MGFGANSAGRRTLHQRGGYFGVGDREAGRVGDRAVDGTGSLGQDRDGAEHRETKAASHVTFPLCDQCSNFVSILGAQQPKAQEKPALGYHDT